jgi:hypothetical protein
MLRHVLAALLAACWLGHMAAPAIAAPPAQPAPDLYQLDGGQIHVVYSTTGLRGRPSLTYRDGSRMLSFEGNEIRTQQTELGTLVTVTVFLTVDTGSTTFTLLLPHVNLGPSNRADIRTVGITTVHRLSPIPGLPQGQTDRYSVTRLQGTAQFVLFARG